jgi:hypothetical protein
MMMRTGVTCLGSFLVVFFAVRVLYNFLTFVDYTKPLPWNPIYRVPDSMAVVGDRSDHYVSLRKEMDEYLASPERYSEHLSHALSGKHTFHPRPMDVGHSDQILHYDIYNCPDTPPAGYPYAWKTLDILRDWPADETDHPPNSIYNSLCVFDYNTDYDKAITYRNASVPYVIVKDPNVAQTAARWSVPNYMERLLGNVRHRAEYSKNNHFMFALPPSAQKMEDKTPKGWKEPTKLTRMSYKSWLGHANVSSDHVKPSDPHWYFRLIGCGALANDGSCDGGASEFLFDELPYFQPKKNLYIVNPKQQEGIHCRFGMQGVISENHFDSSRNAIVVLKGSRRYIISHPDQCDHLALYPNGHPSARHSAVDWSKPDLETHPNFQEAHSSEVVLQAGDVLYLPTYWFHYIVSLDLNVQCNTRSGVDEEGELPIGACGF